MVSQGLRILVVFVALLVAFHLATIGSNSVYAQNSGPILENPFTPEEPAADHTVPPTFSGMPDRYIVPPGPQGVVGAEMYLAPLPTPPWVGHTYFTYGPLMPHEFLYKHRRRYVRQNAQGGQTRTRVRWR